MSQTPKKKGEYPKNNLDSKSFLLRMGGGNLCHIPPGEYEAIVHSVSVEKKYNRKTLVLMFEIHGGENDGEYLRGFANANYEVFSKETKVSKWVECSLGRELEEGEDIDPVKAFQERILKVQVEDKETKGGILLSNITDIIGLVREL
jgi:hypothetical protein